MNTYIVSSLAESVGMLWKKLQSGTKSGIFYIAAPLSNTPLPIYEWVLEHAREFENWNKTTFVLMDEMVEGISPEVEYIDTNDPASYEGFAHQHFIDPLKEKVGIEIEVIKPGLSEINSFGVQIDLLILALGIDGNYANVMPGTEESVGWHIAHLTEDYRQVHTNANGAYAGSEFREYGMSLGPQQVLSARQVVVVISGVKKHGLAERLLSYNHFDPEFPLSIIYHSAVKEKVSLYITEDVGISSA